MRDDFQKRTERELASIKSTFEDNNKLSYEIFQQMPIGICITNPKGYFTDVNATYCDIYGYTREELIGKPFTVVVPEDNRQTLEKLHEDFLEKEYELQGRWTVQNSRSETFEIITNAAFLIDEHTQEKRKMTLVVKAAELELTVKRLRTTIEILENKIKTQDIANRLAEHDMRNRIGSMVSIADILSKSNLDPVQSKWVRMLKDIGNDTLNLLTSSKDFAQMERGEYIPTLSKFDLLELIASTTGEMRELIEEKKATIELYHNNIIAEPEEDELMMEGDKFYMKHLFQNLLRNAIEASPEGKKVTIALETNNLFVINIKNSGVIPEKMRAKFFDKYTTEGKDRGTGLGTYIAKMIAEIHDGNLTFLTGKDDSTTLILKLPKTILI
ncbi:PAS domain-containing sensor histidine kinase [Dokdonia sinensis]|uniref:PAS domain-containing sensor histidine kinase n=1 Tax=Dokdonia sinensis TaxID=2479847 RepID=A0A3M0GCY0_9FLAO|nr:PAS domain-containing sensor histidine kinase [Dokdonia sinensis]RMB59443.1 PAS domain-containing sensor histidine kinase [Dokdonia sinensis]